MFDMRPDKGQRLWKKFGSYHFGQCCAINVGFELHIVIESNISISNIGFYFDSGEFCHNFHSIPIPIIHSGMYFNLPAISAKLNQVVLPFDI